MIADSNPVLGLILIMFVIGMYLLPTFVALDRNASPNKLGLDPLT